jgi:hypothetical protein
VNDAVIDVSSFDLSEGDRVVFDFNDNGDFLFDQGNVAITLVPTPAGTVAFLCGPVFASRRRRS